MKIVHVNKEPYDIYIGRGKCPATGRLSIWGNPFSHIADKETLAQFIVSSRDEAISRYREYLLNNEALMASIMELDGKILGCWCIRDADNPPIPYICHGQVIIEVLTNLKVKNFLFNRK
jgi:hypothetical protein